MTSSVERLTWDLHDYLTLPLMYVQCRCVCFAANQQASCTLKARSHPTSSPAMDASGIGIIQASWKKVASAFLVVTQFKNNLFVWLALSYIIMFNQQSSYLLNSLDIVFYSAPRAGEGSKHGLIIKQAPQIFIHFVSAKSSLYCKTSTT